MPVGAWWTTIKKQTMCHLVRKYLEDHQSELLFQQSEIALSCLIYLCLPVFDKPAHDDHIFERHEEFSLSSYAGSFWAEHVRHTQNERSVEVETAVFEAFRSEERCTVIGLHGDPQDLDYGDIKIGRHLIHILVKERISFVVTRPLSDNRITAW